MLPIIDGLLIASRLLGFAFIAAFVALLPGVARADAVPGDACTTANAYTLSGGPETSGTVYLMTCQSGVWVRIMEMSTAGNVGIGTTSPAQALDVTGNINVNAITGGYYIANSKILFEPASDTTSIAVGSGSLAAQTATNLSNTAVGYQALNANTTGTGNTANGMQALKNNITGSWNTANGSYALNSNTTGNSNAAAGYAAILHNTTGSSNSAYGYWALSTNTTGRNNVALGYLVGSTTLTTGSNNILIGTSSLVDTTASNSSNQLNIGNLIYGDMAGVHVGLGSATINSGAALDLSSQSNSLLLPTGITGQRPTGTGGMARYNSTTDALEGYFTGTATWSSLLTNSVLTLGTTATAANPARSGDPGIGLFSGTASTVSIATAGVEALRVTATGSVGIGTTGPVGQFDVSSGGISRFEVDNGNYGGVVVGQRKANDGYASLVFNNGTNSNQKLEVDPSGSMYVYTAGTQRMLITNGGNVWITGGTLDVYGGSTKTVLNVNGTTDPQIRMQNAGVTKLEIGIPTSTGNYITGSAVNDVTFRQTAGQKILFSSSATGATNDLTLSGGNVGIGTTSPAYLFHVYQNTAADVNATLQNANSGYAAYFKTMANSNYSANWSIGTGASWFSGQFGSANYVVRDATNSTTPFTIVQAAPTNSLYISATGSVGIGTASPGYMLQVNGDIGLTTAGQKIYLGNPNNWLERNVGDGATYIAGASNILLIPSQGAPGNVGVSTSTSVYPGSLFSINGNLAVGSSYFATAAPSNGAIIQGNVGIGTSSPQATLDVNGDAKLKINSAAPVTCDATHEGSIAYTGTTTHYLCFCDGTSWKQAHTPATACTW